MQQMLISIWAFMTPVLPRLFEVWKKEDIKMYEDNLWDKGYT